MLVYRITHKDYSKDLYASGMKGRWNSAGKKVIYCAQSIELAFLENMVRRQGVGFNNDFRIMIIEVPDDLAVEVITPADLEDGWRDVMDYSKCQPAGDTWFDEGRATLLKVPSAILPEGYNYVINTQHPDFTRIKIVGVTNLVPDERIDKLLKKYPGKK